MAEHLPRVVHIVSSLSTYGAERLVAGLAARLPADVFDTKVMTVYRAPDGAAPGLDGRVIDIARRGRYDATFFGRMVGELRRVAPDIVHTHTHNGKFWGRLAAVAARVPVIVHTEHSGDYLRGAPPVHLANRFLHGRTAAIVGFTRAHVDHIAAREGVDPRKLHVIPNGVIDDRPRYRRDRVRRELDVASDRAIVLVAARFAPPKLHALAVDAWTRNPELRERAVLAFAGNGADEARIRARAWGAGLAESVRFLGYRADVPELLGGVDALLLASAYEAMPLAAIEAMRAGVPVVSNPWPGASAFFADGRLGQLAATNDPDALARALLASLDGGADTRARADAAAAIAHARYSIDACVDAHVTLYRSLLAGAVAEPATGVAPSSGAPA